MQDAINQAAETFSCPGCGGRPVWDPESGGMKCPFCGTATKVEQDTAAPKEYDINSAPTAQQSDWGDGKRVVRCKGCGAETILGANETASFCAFCGSPHVLEDQSAAGIAPESVLPFRVTQKSAVAAFRKWLKHKWFAPGKAKRMAQLGQITGVYLPHWTYDSNAASDYTGEAGFHYYVTVPVTVERDGKQVTEMRQEQRTRWEPTAGQVDKYFDDIVVPGSTRLDSDLLGRVQPYDLTQLCRYRAEFLSGFAAEKPSVDVKAGWKTAEQEIDREMTSLAEEDILARADEARVSGIRTKNSNVRYKLTLLPMYLSSFMFKDKTYHVLVNGENGRCGGEAPVSFWRVLAAILVVAAVLVGGYLLLESGGFLD